MDEDEAIAILMANYAYRTKTSTLTELAEACKILKADKEVKIYEYCKDLFHVSAQAFSETNRLNLLSKRQLNLADKLDMAVSKATYATRVRNADVTKTLRIFANMDIQTIRSFLHYYKNKPEMSYDGMVDAAYEDHRTVNLVVLPITTDCMEKIASKSSNISEYSLKILCTNMGKKVTLHTADEAQIMIIPMGDDIYNNVKKAAIKYKIDKHDYMHGLLHEFA